MTEVKVVIKWERLKDWKDVDELKNEDLDYGVYMITGWHPIFGDDSLLYIGIAQERTFCSRFREHKGWLEQEGDVTIYVGRVDSIDGNKDYTDNNWGRIINDVESFLIYYFTPPYNSSKINQSPNSSSPLRIINIGDYGDLYPEISHEGLELENSPARPTDE